MQHLTWLERQNLDYYSATSTACITDWFQYGINPNDVDEDNLRNNYVDILRKYGDKIMYILTVFAYNKLKNTYKLKINTKLCKDLISQFKNIKNLQYKNPYLLILGFWIRNTDNSLNTELFKEAVAILPEIDEYKLFPEDILRYYNFWNSV